MSAEEVLAELNSMLGAEARTDADAIAIAERYGSPVHLKHVPHIRCADGFLMSVQASWAHYCSPRDSEGPWDAVEVGFPSERVEAFMPYIDGGPDEDPTKTVYGYVPLSIVAQTIVDHGGFARSVQP